ncbi:MAG TPA: radical SAM family heme chaperone HemW [Gemmata sp.]|jgi:oxygen-independent coproporphyrinogen-3 oxidase|nr:radical SAM family heme chaperone HemW [Gemmata sp.]
MNQPPPWLDPRTAYIHIPFCAHHCGYCDFAVSAGQDHLIGHYLDALTQELGTLGKPRAVETLFIGGGTPTYLNADQLQQLLATINHWLPSPRGCEFSIESTPDSLTDEKAAVLAAHGVTRVSIGVQSFRRELLTALDRQHTVNQIPWAVETIRRRGLDLSFDLIFAAPGSTIETWESDLIAALEFAPIHLSTYGLTYEKGTPLWKQRHRGAVHPVGEDDELSMYELAIDRLTTAGFEHYEISNFARPGFRCRHNERYWANEAYYGFGVGAARYVYGARELNTRDTKTYIQKVLSGESPTFQSERLNNRDRAFETIGTQLRRAIGIERSRFREQTGLNLDTLVASRLVALVSNGLLADNGDSVSLTRRGFCVADGVIEDLMKANGPGAENNRTSA